MFNLNNTNTKLPGFFDLKSCNPEQCKFVSLFMIQVDFDQAQTKSLDSCSRCGYKVELNLSYARETETAKIRCQYYMWLIIKTIKTRILHLKNGSWLMTFSTARIFFFL